MKKLPLLKLIAFIGLALPLALLIGTRFLSIFPPISASAGDEKSTLDYACTRMLLIFPHSTKLVAFRRASFLDESIDLLVEIDPDDVDVFMRNDAFRDIKPSMTEKSIFVLDPPAGAVEQWRARDVRRFASGQARLPNYSNLSFLLDFDRNDVVRIYLSWWES